MDGFLGYRERITYSHVSSIVASIKYSAQAIADLKRLHDFLATQDAEVAKRAVTVIRDALQKVAFMPERFRPVNGKLYQREALIDFGSSGYVARFRHLPSGEITITRIRHQKEDAFG